MRLPAALSALLLASCAGVASERPGGVVTLTGTVQVLDGGSVVLEDDATGRLFLLTGEEASDLLGMWGERITVTGLPVAGSTPGSGGLASLTVLEYTAGDSPETEPAAD
jgi:hypothetical protein